MGNQGLHHKVKGQNILSSQYGVKSHIQLTAILMSLSSQYAVQNGLKYSIRHQIRTKSSPTGGLVIFS